MVGRMPKRQAGAANFGIKRGVDADQLATEFGAVPETPEQRRKSILEAQQNSMAIQSAIAAHDAKEERRMHELSRRAKSPGNMLTMADLLGGFDPNGPQLSRADVMQGMDMGSGGGGSRMLTEEFPTMQDDYLMEELYQQPRQAPRQAPRQVRQPVQPLRQPQPQRQALTERRPEPKLNLKETIRSTTENWRAKRYIGETRSGNEIHVWRVENTKTGTKLDTLFRLEGVASRVALCLNESGDINDPRAVGLVNTYQRRDKLLKEARALEKSADGKPMKSERLKQIRAEINQLDYKLGV